MTMTRAWFHTFGCKANQYDTERMRQSLESSGVFPAASPDAADLAVLNTCTVTSEADRDARRLIRRLAREHPGLRIVVAGCSAALREAEYASMPEVWRVVPGQDPGHVVRAAISGGDQGLVRLRGAGSSLLARFRRGTRAWLKVQDGCDRRCSFCATRIARGGSRSRAPEEVVAEARLLAREHPELVITGIHIGHYGQDLPGRCSLSRLCARLLEEVPGVRVRLSSIEATEIDDLLIDLLAGSDGRLVPHLHVPLQSGSDDVLRRMRRWHTREGYRARVLEIAARLPYLGLGADIIVGFPGESEADHAETRALVEELPYTYLHVFPFSARVGTAAASFPGTVPGDIKAARARELRELGRDGGRAYRASRVGGMAEMVVETLPERSLPEGSLPEGQEGATGLTEDYLRVEAALEDFGGPGRLRSGAVLRGALGGDADRLRLMAAS